MVNIPQEVGLLGRDATGWRRCKKAVGQIAGLPSSHGMLEATNGLLCAIRRADGSVFIGHLDFFEKVRAEVGVTGITRPGRPRVSVADLLTEYDF